MRPEAALLLAALLSTLTTDAGAAPSIERSVVVLQGLDKVTARVSVLEVPVGREQIFGTLAITPRACLETPPTEPPESAAFLEIALTDRDAGAGEEEGGGEGFIGWMFASSPALSALEHPVYDVWVIGCGDSASFTGSGLDGTDPIDRPSASPVEPSAKE